MRHGPFWLSAFRNAMPNERGGVESRFNLWSLNRDWNFLKEPGWAMLATDDQTTRAAIVTFGEAMLRYSVEPGERLSHADVLRIHPGGAELNVGVGLANLGEPVRYVTALPDSPLGQRMWRFIAEQGVEVVGDLAAPGRMGIYYLEPGVPPRPGVVTYDRQDSAFSRYPWSQFDWERVLEPGGVFLTTGITAALSAEALEGVRRSLETAARKGLLVVFDVNYRSKLWTPEEAREALVPLLKHVNLLFTSVSDATVILGAPEMDPEELPAWLASRYELDGVTLVYTPEAPKEPIQWRAFAWYKGETASYDQPAGVVAVDRLGAGDAYAAGFLWSLRQGKSLADAVRYGSAMMALKNTIHGDFGPFGPEELEHASAVRPAGVQR